MTDQTELLTTLLEQLKNDGAVQRIEAIEQLGRVDAVVTGVDYVVKAPAVRRDGRASIGSN